MSRASTDRVLDILLAGICSPFKNGRTRRTRAARQHFTHSGYREDPYTPCPAGEIFCGIKKPLLLGYETLAG